MDNLSLVIGDNRADVPYVLGSAFTNGAVHDFSQEARTGMASSIHYDGSSKIVLSVELDSASQSGKPVFIRADLEF